MKKMFLVLALVLVASLAASAAPVKFNFSFDGFCDFMKTQRFTPAPGVIPKVWLAGIHDLNTNCGLGVVAGVGGFKHGNSKTIPPNVAPVDDFSSPIEPLFGLPYSLNYLVHEPNLTAGCVWANYFGNGQLANGAGLYLLNVGTCTKFVAAAPASAGGPSVKR